MLWIYYFQLRMVLTQKSFQIDLQKGMMDFKVLLSMNDCSTKGKLSSVYKILLKTDEKPLLQALNKWGKDCKKQFTREDRGAFFQSYMMTTSFLPLKLQTIKLLHRWYLIA